MAENIGGAGLGGFGGHGWKVVAEGALKGGKKM
jgi:hypothetical protein